MSSAATGYFSERELGPRPLLFDDLPSTAWLGISATFRRFAERHYFAAEFPEQCPDGQGISGTDMAALENLLNAHVPKLRGVPIDQQHPDTVTAMDVVEFGWLHVQEPQVTSRHSYFHHNHYQFDQKAGRDDWREQINRILGLNSVALRLEANGRVARIGTVAAEMVVQTPIPKSGDPHLDAKIDSAVSKCGDPDSNVRQEALEALWDALERVKTVIDPNDKKQSADALIGLMAGDVAGRAVLTDEFRTLTEIGNEFQIRHHEVARHPIDSAMIDLFFVRGLALVEGAVRALVRHHGQ